MVTTLHALKFVLHIACMQCSDGGKVCTLKLGAGAVYIRVVMVEAHCVQSGVQQATRAFCWLQGPWVAPPVVLLLLAAREHSA